MINCEMQVKSPGIVADMWNYDILGEFELQLSYYILFQTNAHGKNMNPFITLNYGLKSTTTFILQGFL